MHHITLVCPAQEVSSLAEELRQLGVLHLEALEDLPPPQTEAWQAYQKALQIARQYQAEGIRPEADIGSAPQLAEALAQAEAELARLDFRNGEVERDLSTWARWGDLDPQKLAALERLGLQVALFESAEKIFLQTDFAGVITQVVERKARRVCFAAFGRKEDLEVLPFEAQALPDKSREALLAEQKELQTLRDKTVMRLQQYAQAQTNLQEALENLEEEWTFQQATQAFQAKEEDMPHVLKGWVPQEKIPLIQKGLDGKAVAYASRPANKGERVPVELKNKAFSRLFEPITRIFQLPHYFEYDLTPFIAVFYPLLFAYCLGDAGYGAVLSLVALLALLRMGKSNPGIPVLALVLGLTTTVMGLIKSGSLFGIALSLDHQNPFIRYLGQFVIIPDGGDFFFNAFNVALLIGVVQILSGVLIAFFKAWRYDGFLPALSHLGKFFILTAAILLFLGDDLGFSAFIALALKLQLALGVLMVMFFHDMGLALLPRLGSSILPLFFIFTGLLGDVLSYVRLFALGVTSSVLGLVVNQIGMDMASDRWWTWLGAGAFLLFGHLLNFFLAALGAFIHPLRLTFVEFYNNAQFEGGGQIYQPFQRTTSKSS